MTELIDKIRTRGSWLVQIRPLPYEKARVGSLQKLEEILASATVSLRGWDFPHTDPRAGMVRGLDHISNSSEWQQFLETWRFYRSGQFVSLSGLYEDWRDQGAFGPAPQGWQPGLVIGVFEIVWRVTEIFEFAARLAMSDAGSDALDIAVTLAGMRGRRIWMDDTARVPLIPRAPAQIDAFPYTKRLDRTRLVGDTRGLAIEPIQRMLELFGLDLTDETIRSLQDELRK